MHLPLVRKYSFVRTLLATASIIGCSMAHAQYVWDPLMNHAGSDGSGLWDNTTPNFASGGTNAAWNNGTNAGTTAVFGGGGTAGTVMVGTILAGGLTFNSGVTGNYFLSGGSLTLAGGSFIRTDANAAISSSLTSSNGLVKSGAGDLALTGTSSIDSFGVIAGSITQSAGTISSYELAVGTGSGNNGSYNLSGGTINFLSGTPPPFVGGSASSFRIGDFGGTGVFNQTGGTINVSGSLNVGNQGGNGTYNISAGTLNLANGLYSLGRATGAAASTGVINLSGTGAINVVSGQFFLGDRDATGAQGTGTLMQTGGTLAVAAGAQVFLGGFGSSTYNLNGGSLQVGGGGLQGALGSGTYAFNLGGGTIQVTGSALSTSVDANLTANTYSFLNTNGLGATWSGNFTGANGGLVKTGTGDLALTGTNSAFGTFLVAGGSVSQGAGVVTTSELAVGTGAGNTASYNFSGGTINLPVGAPPPIVGGSASSLRVGDFGGTGTFNQTGGTVNVSGSLNVGNQGGNGTYNISAGTLNLADGLYSLGRTTSSSPGGLASTGIVNLSGTGAINVVSGQFFLGDRDGTGPQGTGTLNQTGGTLAVAPGAQVFLGGFGNSTYNLNGGSLQVGGGGLQGALGSGTYAFNLGGGTVQVTGSALSTSVNANLTANTYSFLNTNGLGATWSGNFTGANGGLVKTGAGDLALTGTNSAFGTFLVAGGSVSQGAGVVTTSELAVGTGAGNTASYNLSGGTINLPVGTPPPIVGGSASSLRVGDFGGTGTFNQTGGTVNVSGSLNVGNQGGNGTYNVSAGTLNLADGLYSLGRTTSSSPGGLASTGVVNLSGTGAINVVSGQFFLGDRDGTGPQGSGTLNQTGGTLAVAPGAQVFLGGFGNSTYNLNGGSLQVGGGGLQGALGSGTYAFNLGGGTVQVTGSALSTSVNATLTPATSSTINTNGLGATWSGVISGSGNLVKTGAGTLSLTAQNTFSGTTTVSGGTLSAAGTPAAPALGATSQLILNSGGTVLLAANQQINGAASLVLNGGTFNTGGFDQTLGTLTLSAVGSVIDMFSPGQNVLAFADSSGVAWTGTLSIYNWSGTTISHTPGGDVFGGNPLEQLSFGNSSSGLTSSQLASITFFSDAGFTALGGAEILGNGGLAAAVPEPATYVAAALALALLAWSQRSRLPRLGRRLAAVRVSIR